MDTIEQVYQRWHRYFQVAPGAQRVRVYVPHDQVESERERRGVEGNGAQIQVAWLRKGIAMWYDVFIETTGEALATVRAHLPTLGAAALLVLAGWVLAHLCRRWARKLIDRLMVRFGATSRSLSQAMESSGAGERTPRVVAAFVFWIVLLLFLAAAVESLGLPVVTDFLAKVAAYTPNLMAAAVIVLAGLVSARVARSAALRAAAGAGISQAAGLAAMAEGVVLVLAAVIAVEQLGVNARVLELTVGLMVGSALAAIALAFGLGAKGLVANLIAAHYVGRLVQVGQKLRIDDVTGTVVQITPTAVVVEAREGRVIMPAQRFHSTDTTLLHEEI